MNDRILVKVTAAEHCIDFRTISRRHKSLHFVVPRDRFAELEYTDKVIADDLYSFAVFQRDASAGTLRICFTWLRGSSSHLSGWEETVVLPYDELTDFVNASAVDNDISQWRHLSIETENAFPQLVFCDVKRLHECLSQRDVRRKLVRFLRDNFQWPGSGKICFYYDFVPYSFFFQEIQNGVPCLTGVLILHEQEHMDRAYYSIHT